MKAQLNKDVESDDFLTFDVKGVKFVLVGVEEIDRKFYYTIKNVQKKTYSVLTHNRMKEIVKDF